MGRLTKAVLLLILALMISILFPVAATAETLALDSNGEAIQLSRYWTCESDSIPAQAPSVSDSTAVPANAAEVVIVFRHQAGYVRPASATSVSASGWAYIPVNTPVTLPVMNSPYIVYRSATGAARINLLWKRM